MRHRPTEQIALQVATAAGRQPVTLLRLLDAFGDEVAAEARTRDVVRVVLRHFVAHWLDP